MSLAEAITNGVFGLLKTLISLAGMFLLFHLFTRAMNGAFTRGKHHGQLHQLSPRRLWCKHRVSTYGPGEHGLWALWCADCGNRVNRK